MVLGREANRAAREMREGREDERKRAKMIPSDEAASELFEKRR
jgi:hypothetical protein